MRRLSASCLLESRFSSRKGTIKAIEKTYSMLKPDAVRNHHIGEIVSRIERATLLGATNPAEAAPGTIRGDFGLIMDENVIHGSDSPESAEREIGIFFGA